VGASGRFAFYSLTLARGGERDKEFSPLFCHSGNSVLICCVSLHCTGRQSLDSGGVAATLRSASRNHEVLGHVGRPPPTPHVSRQRVRKLLIPSWLPKATAQKSAAFAQFWAAFDRTGKVDQAHCDRRHKKEKGAGSIAAPSKLPYKQFYNSSLAKVKTLLARRKIPPHMKLASARLLSTQPTSWLPRDTGSPAPFQA